MKVSDNTKYLSKTIAKLRNSDQATKIVCYSDSITYGYIANSGTPNYDTGTSQVAYLYPKALQDILGKIYPSNTAGITIINSGRCGWQSDEAVGGLQQYVLSNNPDLCVLMFDTNDVQGSSFGGSQSVDVFKANMLSVVKTLLDNNIEVFYLHHVQQLTVQVTSNY